MALPETVLPEAPMPTDPTTVRVLLGEVDAWWAALSPGQKMSAYLAGSGVLCTVPAHHLAAVEPVPRPDPPAPYAPPAPLRPRKDSP